MQGISQPGNWAAQPQSSLSYCNASGYMSSSQLSHQLVEETMIVPIM